MIGKEICVCREKMAKNVAKEWGMYLKVTENAERLWWR